MNIIIEFFNTPIVLRALIVGILVSLCAALLGVNLVLKRYSMIGDGLSHVGFGALALAIVLDMGNAPLKVAVPIVVIAAFMLLRLKENGKIKSDAAIALLSSSSLAIGVILISMKRGMNTDITNYMFGSILAITKEDLYLSTALAAIVIIAYTLFYNQIFAVTFDEIFARATGVKTEIYNVFLALMTALIIVVGMRIMGAMLISSLIIFPALTSTRILKSFKGVVICSGILSVMCFFFGIFISFAIQEVSIPAGASVVVVNLLAFCVFSLLGFIYSKRKKFIKK